MEPLAIFTSPLNVGEPEQVKVEPLGIFTGPLTKAEPDKLTAPLKFVKPPAKTGVPPLTVKVPLVMEMGVLKFKLPLAALKVTVPPVTTLTGPEIVFWEPLPASTRKPAPLLQTMFLLIATLA